MGVFLVATTTLAAELHSTFFKVVGTIVSLVVVTVGMSKRTVTSELFHAPGIATWEKKRAQRMTAKSEKV